MPGAVCVNHLRFEQRVKQDEDPQTYGSISFYTYPNPDLQPVPPSLPISTPARCHPLPEPTPAHLDRLFVTLKIAT